MKQQTLIGGRDCHIFFLIKKMLQLDPCKQLGYASTHHYKTYTRVHARAHTHTHADARTPSWKNKDKIGKGGVV